MKPINVKPKPDNARGFTLLEVLIAVVILSIGILATTKLQLSFIQSNSKSVNITEGSAQVQAKIEELSNLAYDDLVSANDTYRVNDGNGREYTFTWVVVANSPQADTKTVTVSVAWPDEKNISRTVNYTFMKTDLFTGAE